MSENDLRLPENQVEAPRPFSILVWIVLFVVLISFIIGFDRIKEWGGRVYYESKIPDQLTEQNIVAAFGEPDKKCDGDPECMKFLDPFIFQKKRPEFHSYFVYTEHYPLLPLLVFFEDEQGDILGYDFGLN